MAIRGVIWYQGEDDGRNKKYTGEFTGMIESWRKLWGQPKMPFYFVQIAQTGYASGMLGVWESQVEVMRDVPHTGLAVANDIYDGQKTGYAPRPDKLDKLTGWPIAGGSNPHPPNKQLVANRLADIALVKTYGQGDRVVFGPVFESMKITGSKIVVKLKHAGSGLKTTGGELNWFEISDGVQERRKIKYVKAQAKIIAPDTIEVHSPEVKSPKHVRFAWYALARHNLVNSAGLPATSFRTDRLPGMWNRR